MSQSDTRVDVEKSETPARKPRGFAAMDPDKRRALARKGGKQAHIMGTAHQFTREEAQAAGRKGGLATGPRKRGRKPKAEEGATAPALVPYESPADAVRNRSLKAERRTMGGAPLTRKSAGGKGGPWAPPKPPSPVAAKKGDVVLSPVQMGRGRRELTIDQLYYDMVKFVDGGQMWLVVGGVWPHGWSFRDGRAIAPVACSHISVAGTCSVCGVVMVHNKG